MVRSVNRFNSKASQSRSSRQVFVRAGEKSRKRRSPPSSLLLKTGASDWTVNFDFHGNHTIPHSTGVVTTQRPDIVFYSTSTKMLISLEGTVPLERNIVNARLRKELRYTNLVHELRLKDWTVYDLAYEIGALGFIGKSFNFMLSPLGFSSAQKKSLRRK